MLKKFLISTFAALTLSVVPQMNAVADEGTFCSVKIDNSNVILISDEAEKDGCSTLRLTLNVDNEIDDDTVFYFELNESTEEFKVLDCRYNPDSKQLNIYISQAENLFKESNSLNIGTLKAKNAVSGKNVDIEVSADEDALQYVVSVDTADSADTDESRLSNAIKTAPPKATDTTTTTSTATTKPTTTTTTTITTTTTTSATTTKQTTTTTTTSETTKPTTTTTTTSETTSKPTTTTSATTKPTTSITMTSATTKSTTTTSVKHIASDEVLCDWSINNYNKENGIMPDSAEITEQADGNYQITLTDGSDNILDVYVINPKTGIGKDSDGNEVNLPQTGNNSLKNVLTAVGALMITAFGFCAVKLSDINRRKKNEQ